MADKVKIYTGKGEEEGHVCDYCHFPVLGRESALHHHEVSVCPVAREWRRRADESESRSFGGDFGADHDRRMRAAVAGRQFVVRCGVSGGMTGTREALLKENGQVKFFATRETAEAEVKALRARARDHRGPASFTYQVEEVL